MRSDVATIDIADDAKMSDLWRLRKLEEKIIAENRDLFNLRHILAIREMVPGDGVEPPTLRFSVDIYVP